jgi:hypothetical protein
MLGCTTPSGRPRWLIKTMLLAPEHEALRWTMVQSISDGWCSGYDSLIAHNLVSLVGDIEIDPHQDSLILQIEIFNAQFISHPFCSAFLWNCQSKYLVELAPTVVGKREKLPSV